jgi:hypothetical protein
VTHRLAALVFTLHLALTGGQLAAQSAPDPDPLPFAPGTTWVYKGTVWWTPVGRWNIYQERVTWEVEVADTIVRGDVHAAVMKGYPQDLAWLERERLPSEYLLIRVGGSRFYLLGGERGAVAERRLRDRQDPLVDLVYDSELLLDLPLRTGKRFCTADQITREDRFHCWVVESEAPADLRSIRGVDSNRAHTRYTIALRTGGEHQIYGFVPGVGFTSYAFGHQGTVSAVEVDLVQVRAPSDASGTAQVP